MNITMSGSEFSINNLTGIMNELEKKDSAKFKNKNIKIVIAARQYCGSSILSRGFGDVASGVRGFEYVRDLFPKAKYSFVLEHHAEDSSELETLRSITTIEGVETFVLDGRHARSERSPLSELHQEAEVSHLLQEANFIFHGPFGVIAPLEASNGEYAHKTLRVTEYDLETGISNRERYHRISEYDMGFFRNRLYLMKQSYLDAEFRNESLRYYCINPMDKSSSNNDKNVFYFAYGHTYEFLAQMMRALVLIEGDNNRDVVLVSSKQFDLDKYSTQFTNLLPSCCPYKSVKVFQNNSNGKKIEVEIYNNLQGQQEKNIHIITPNRLENSDFYLLQKGSVINYSSGDISTSDILSEGKIPLLDPYKKRALYFGLLNKIKEFCNIQGNAHYLSLISVWETAASSFTLGFQKKKPYQIATLQRILTPQWKTFEYEFTHWLKQHNQTESFIRKKIEEII